jgi:hypothetical protein
VKPVGIVMTAVGDQKTTRLRASRIVSEYWPPSQNENSIGSPVRFSRSMSASKSAPSDMTGLGSLRNTAYVLPGRSPTLFEHAVASSANRTAPSSQFLMT